MSGFSAEAVFAEAADWNLADANVRVGPSGVHGALALEADALLQEMDRFYIRAALVSHWAAEEYGAEAGMEALARDSHPRLLPAWPALPDPASLAALATRRPYAVRLTPAATAHNFSLAPWCAGALFESLAAHAIPALLSLADVGWDRLAQLLQDFPRLPLILLDIGYRSDRYLFPLLEDCPNLYFDSATYLAHRQLEAFVEGHGAERILFGSRLPLYTPAAALGVLASARMSDTQRLAIAGGNLRRLLALAGYQPPAATGPAGQPPAARNGSRKDVVR